MAFTMVTVIADYSEPDGTAASGRVTFTPSVAMSNADIVVSAPASATLNASGEISISLAATDDPSTQPTGAYYVVTEYLNHVPVPRTWNLNVPYNTVGSLDLATVSPAEPGPVQTSYALAGHSHGAPAAPLDMIGASASTDVITTSVTADANKRLIIDADGKHNFGDGTATQDTTLYRSAADTLKTDDSLVVATKATVGNATLQTDKLHVEGDGTTKVVFAKATATGTATNAVIAGESSATGKRLIDVRVTGDAVSRLRVDTSATGNPGTIVFGDGTTADTNLYRSAADTLKTDDSLVVATNLSVTGTSTLTGNVAVTGNLTVTGVGSIRAVRRTSGQAVTSSTTLVDDNTLQLSVEANAVYIVELAMAVTAGGGGFKHSFAGPASATMPNWGDTTEARFSTIGAVDAWPSVTSSYLTIDGLLVTAGTAGTFKVQWAQNSSNAAATTMLTGSFMKITRIE